MSTTKGSLLKTKPSVPRTSRRNLEGQLSGSLFALIDHIGKSLRLFNVFITQTENASGTERRE